MKSPHTPTKPMPTEPLLLDENIPDFFDVSKDKLTVSHLGGEPHVSLPFCLQLLTYSSIQAAPFGRSNPKKKVVYFEVKFQGEVIDNGVIAIGITLKTTDLSKPLGSQAEYVFQT